jgi:hypothetical protein
MRKLLVASIIFLLMSSLVPSALASYYIGKGLKEPCSPYRSTYVFGADLNTPNANNWNCLAEIWDSTTYFDLSQITKNHEVVVVLYTQDQDLSTGTTLRAEWYRKRDNKLLFTYEYNLPNPPSGYYWDWYYAYSYIGWVDWEINENGDYYVKVSDSARGTSQTIYFTVTGIPICNNNGVCESGETPSNCPNDCKVTGTLTITFIGLLSIISLVVLFLLLPK